MMTNLLNGAHVANKLFSTIARLRLLLVMFVALSVSAEVWGAEGDVVYTLSCVQSKSNSAYANYYDVTINSKQWNAPGNQTLGAYWRIGGAKGTSVSRNITGKSIIDKPIKKITVSHNGRSNTNLTVNSFSVTVARDANFSNIVETKTISSPSVSNAGSFDLSPTNSVWETGCYYKFTIVYTHNKSSNYGLDLTSIVFYEGSTTPSCTNPTISTQPTGATYTKDDSPTILSVVASGDDLTYQWYSNTSNSTSGATKINGATNSTYTPSTSTVGTKYYYCIVSSGSCSTTSNIVSVVVKNPPFTVTLNAGPGTCAASVTEASAGAGVTLPTPTLNGCGEWTFAGWKTTSAVATETTTKPTLIAAGAYSPTSDITLYAVYQRTETTSGGGGGESHSITITPNIFTNKGSNNYGSGAERIGSENAVNFGGHYITGNVKNTPSSGATAGTYLQCQANNATIYNKTELPGKITKIVVNQHEARAFSLYCGKEQLVASNNTNTGVTPSGTKITDTSSATTMTWNVSGDYTFFAIKKGNNASYVTSIVITYQTDGGQSETTYYHSTPDCGTTEPSVTLNPNGGDFDPKPNGWTQEGENYKKEGVTGAITLPTPTRTGYDFKGWYDAASGGTEIADGGEDYTPSEDIVLYAQWDPITYTIRLNPGSGSCDNNQISGTYSEGVKLPTASPSNACTEEGWTFAGWAETNIIEETTTSPDPLYVAGSTYNPVENIILYAVYVKQTFTLSLVDNSTTYYVGGYESSKSILTAETDVNNAMDFRIVDGQYLRCESGYISHNSASSTNISCYPSKDGNVFPWTITENTGTISFQSTKAAGNERYLGYNYNGGNPRFAVYVESYAHNFTKNTTTTYTTDPNCCTPLDEITGLTFSAMTRSITVSLPDSYDNTNVDGYIFNLYNAATGGVATTYDTNDKNEKSHTFTGLTPNTAYHFTIIAKGSGAYCNSAETSPRESHTTLPQYTVTWNPAGGNWSGSTADKVDTYDYQAEITKPADPERKGYTFNGWNTTPATIMPAENLTYTAQWNIVTYTITYENLNGATHTNPEEYTVETAPIALTNPTERAGYVFAGWYSDAECTTEVTEIPNGSTGNITLYAKWLNIYTITWKANGLEYETTKVTEGDPIIPPSSPDLGDYCGQVFAGWTDAEMAETTNVAPTLYPNPTPFPTASEEAPKTFYAVFADYDEQQ